MSSTVAETPDLSRGPDLSHVDKKQLTRMERAIAHKYMHALSWPMVIWPFANIGVWLALWPLVYSGALSLWVAFPIAIVNATLAYLPSHEAQHDIYARPGEKLRWLNQLIGHFSLLPIATAYHMLRETHMEHHKNTNHPVLDPDYSYNHEPSGWASIVNTLRSFQPGSPQADAYKDAMQRLNTPECQRAIRDHIVMIFFFYGVLFASAAYGFALEALLIWWLPSRIGTIYLRFYLSWAPHFPGNEIGRYRDTRGFKSWLGAWSSLGMTAHIVHHLYPRIPLNRTPAALREMHPVLQARGCDLVDQP